MLHSQTSKPQWAYRQEDVRAFEATQLERWTDGALMKQAAADSAKYHFREQRYYLRRGLVA